MAKKQKLSELKPDSKNYNKHTEFGMSLLEKSMRKFGFAEAGTISEDNVIISGNARQEVAASIGMEDVEIVDIDGTKPVYLRRKGIKSGTKEFKELALALNATAKANIEWDSILLNEDWQQQDLKDWGIPEFNILPSDDELTAENKNKPACMKITFPTPEDLQKCESGIEELLNRYCPKAFYSVSAGEI